VAELGSSGTMTKALVDHVEDLVATTADGCIEVHQVEVWVLLDFLVHLVELGKELDPLEAHPEELPGERKDLLDVSWRSVCGKSDERVEVKIQFTSDKLGALVGIREAPE
jgi:hypothetical protein